VGDVPSPSHQLIDKHIEGVALQEEDMAGHLRVDDAFAFPGICRRTSCFFFGAGALGTAERRVLST